MTEVHLEEALASRVYASGLIKIGIRKPSMFDVERRAGDTDAAELHLGEALECDPDPYLPVSRILIS